MLTLAYALGHISGGHFNPALTLIHLISIPVTNTSVNPARSIGVALSESGGGWALGQPWLFWVAPIIGGVLGGLIHRWLREEETLPLR